MTNDTLIVVVEGVNISAFVEPGCIAANEATNFELLPFTGILKILYV